MLQKLNFKPGFNKMVTDSGAESQWVDGDFVRFRYGLPEKIGGWNQLTIQYETLPGAARAQHTWTSIAGEQYAAIGTSQGLFIYYGDDFYKSNQSEALVFPSKLLHRGVAPKKDLNRFSLNMVVKLS